MSRKLVVASIALTAVGVILLLISNPFLRFATSTTPQFSGNFTRFAGNFTGGAGNSASLGSRFNASRGLTSATSIESILGLGLVGAGLILEVFSLFLQPQPKPMQPASP